MAGIAVSAPMQPAYLIVSGLPYLGAIKLYKFGTCLLSFNAAVKLEIHLSEGVDHEDHT
jgi:hypothetical protein